MSFYEATGDGVEVGASIDKRYGKAKPFLLWLFVFGCIASVGTYINAATLAKAGATEALDQLLEQVSRESKNVSRSVRSIEPPIDDLADKLYSGEIEIKDIDIWLKHTLTGSAWMQGVGIAFEPYVAYKNSRLWSRHYLKGANERVSRRSVRYDYTDFEYTWYRKPLLEGKLWNEPYYDASNQLLIIEYGVPFWLPGQNDHVDAPSGVVFGSVSAKSLEQLVDLDRNLISYHYVFSEQGRFIVNHTEERLLSGKTIFEYAWEKDDPTLNSVAIHAVAGQDGYVSHIDPVTNAESWMLYQPIEGLGWSFLMVIEQDQFIDGQKMRKHWFIVALLIILSLTVFTGLVCLGGPLSYNRLLTVSIGLSFFVFVGVSGLWGLAEHYPNESSEDELRVTNTNVLSGFQNRKEVQAGGANRQAPRFVKTGVYLQSVEFEQANNIKVSGYVWQRYEKGKHKGLSRSFVLPEAETPHIEEVFRDLVDPYDPDCHAENETARDCEEVIGWYVFSDLRQAFDYSLYPLDSQNVWLRLWHGDFRENVILTPDLDAYEFFNPKLTPGVQSGFVLPGWKITESWFSFRDQEFGTNFGHKYAHGLINKPELFFNVHIQREFINPFVSRVIPVVLISILLFLIVLISAKSGKMAEWLGFSASGVVTGLSALFFVTVINHSELRRFLPSSNIMYFEYFYFVMYVMLLYVAVSAVYIARKDTAGGREENFVTKVLYWPALSFAFFLLTFGVFY